MTPPEALLEPPTASGAVDVTDKKQDAEDVAPDQVRTAYFWVCSYVEGLTPRLASHHDVLVEEPIDYAGAAAVLRNARRADEVEPPVGGTPFGA